MSDLKITPGEWSVAEGGTTIIDERGYEIATMAEPLAILYNWSEKTTARHWADRPGETYIERPEEEVLANARLTAAASKLLEALKACKRELLNWIEATADAGFESDEGDAEALSLADAAIAKAEGK